MCTLTVVVNTPGYDNGTATGTFNVPDGSYTNPYYVRRSDLTNSACPGFSGFELKCDGSQGTISLYSTATCTDLSVNSATNNCSPPTDKYDCINGNCVKNTQYNTPGYFKSLGDCQKICGFSGSCGDGKICIDPNNYCPDNKICIEQSEYSQINQLISKISGEIC